MTALLIKNLKEVLDAGPGSAMVYVVNWCRVTDDFKQDSRVVLRAYLSQSDAVKFCVNKLSGGGRYATITEQNPCGDLEIKRVDKKKRNAWVIIEEIPLK